MKVKLAGTTGMPFEVREVSCHTYEEYTGKEAIPFIQYYADGEGNFYKDEELDFNLDPQHPQATISGWVARDEPISFVDKGNLILFAEKPTRDYYDCNDLTYGFWSDNEKPAIPLSADLFPDVTWDSDPIEVEITIKPKKL